MVTLRLIRPTILAHYPGTYCEVAVTGVSQIEDGATVAFSQEVSFSVDTYEIV